MDYRLYRIETSIQGLLDMIQEDNPEQHELILDQLEKLHLKKDEVILNMALETKNIKLLIEEIKLLERQHKERRNHLEYKLETLRDYIAENQDQPIKNHEVSIHFMNYESLEIGELWCLPEDVLDKKTTITPNKEKIRIVLAKGGKVPGCSLQTKRTPIIK